MANVAVAHPRVVFIDSFNYSHRTLHSLISSIISSCSHPNSMPTMKYLGRNPNFIPGSNFVVNSKSLSNRRQKQSPQKKGGGGDGGGSVGDDSSRSPPNSNGGQLVNGQVNILKRGESLTDFTVPSQRNFGGNNLLKKKFVNQVFPYRTARIKKDRDLHLVKKKTKKKDENRKSGDGSSAGNTVSFEEKKKDGSQKFDKGSSRSLVTEGLVATSKAAKQISVVDFYAGLAVISSPSPSSLPMPAFFKKKNDNNDHATTDLLRLLKLDL